MVGLTDRQQKTSQPKPKASPLRKTTGPPLPTTSSTSGLARHNARTTFIPHARPAAHHEWSGGGQGPLIFFGNKGQISALGFVLIATIVEFLRIDTLEIFRLIDE